ncbi:MAG: hypothetical protein HKN13_08865, partial [Rhodothermales bacterium]|nr:hypothetical protein [Rhodothermales bacterium]
MRKSIPIGFLKTANDAMPAVAYRLGLSALVILIPFLSPDALAQVTLYEEAVIDVGNVGVTVTNAGFVGKAGVRNNPTGPPSFEYPLDSGIEHLFEAGLWVGAIRSDGLITVRTGAQTSAAGYAAGRSGYEFAQTSRIVEQSSLPQRDAFSPRAVSHQDYASSFVDTTTFVPGTSILMPDKAGELGMTVSSKSYAWNFPFTEYFAILNYDIVNISEGAWDSVYVGMYHDLVVRNINTTSDAGSAYFNKGGLGFIDSLNASYAFNAGGTEETSNTYGAVVFLGAEWKDTRDGRTRFFHPNQKDQYEADGYTAPFVNPRWWSFSGGTEELSRPQDDLSKYQRMSTPFPDPNNFLVDADYVAAQEAWIERIRTDGQVSLGNWIGLTPVGPFPRVEPGDTLQVTFALVTALKPDEFQGQAGKPIDTPESISTLANNIFWARRTYSGEDNNFNGVLDTGEDTNANGVLDRYVIPEPPRSPVVRVEFERGEDDRTNPVLYWDKTSERSVDPVTGLRDFEGYRLYRSNPGDDRGGNVLDQATLIGQYDEPGNRTGFNNGFDEIALAEPIVFAGDTTQYWYRFEADGLLAGWQYLFTLTAFDEGDVDSGLPSFESSRVANATRVFPGTPAAEEERQVGVYPNPYRINA